MFEKLTNENFLLYAMKYYDNPNCYCISDLKADLKRIKYIKRLLNRYIQYGELKERLILNHIIILKNSFGSELTVKMLFLKIKPNLYSALKTFFVFLNIMPEVINGLGEFPIQSDEIPLDENIVKILRKI